MSVSLFGVLFLFFFYDHLLVRFYFWLVAQKTRQEAENKKQKPKQMSVALYQIYFTEDDNIVVLGILSVAISK